MRRRRRAPGACLPWFDVTRLNLQEDVSHNLLPKQFKMDLVANARAVLWSNVPVGWLSEVDESSHPRKHIRSDIGHGGTTEKNRYSNVSIRDFIRRYHQVISRKHGNWFRISRSHLMTCEHKIDQVASGFVFFFSAHHVLWL